MSDLGVSLEAIIARDVDAVVVRNGSLRIASRTPCEGGGSGSSGTALGRGAGCNCIGFTSGVDGDSGDGRKHAQRRLGDIGGSGLDSRRSCVGDILRQNTLNGSVSRGRNVAKEIHIEGVRSWDCVGRDVCAGRLRSSESSQKRQEIGGMHCEPGDETEDD